MSTLSVPAFVVHWIFLIVPANGITVVVIYGAEVVAVHAVVVAVERTRLCVGESLPVQLFVVSLPTISPVELI